MSGSSVADAAQGRDRPLRILHTLNGFRWTGAAEPAVQLAREQLRLGHEVAFSVEGGGDLERRIREAGLEVETGFMSRRFQPLAVWRQWRAFRSYLELRRLDIIHAHLLHDHWLAHLARGRADRGSALIRTFHREGPHRSDPLTRHLVRRTEGAIAVSETSAVGLQAAYGIDRDRLLVEGGVVDTGKFRPGADPDIFRAEWNIPAGSPVVGLLSRLREARGIFWLLDAVEPIVRRVPDAVVVFCGRGRHADELRRRIERHPLRERIRYPGYVPPERLNEAYAAFDVHCLLGPGNDGTCRAALQSMACARPLVAADLGALRDLLLPFREDEAPPGLLVPVDDRDALAEAVCRYLGDTKLRSQAGERARSHVERNCRPADQADRVIRFYRSILERST